MCWRPGRRWRVAEQATADDRVAPDRVVKDMAITHADFFRTLAPLLRGVRHEISGDGVTIWPGEGRIAIRLGPEGTRTLGNFRLPRTSVELSFHDCPAEAIAEFIARFDLRFRRGGG
jgi:hypothetical protein